MAKTARRQLGGRYLLFGEYLPSWTNVNIHYRMGTFSYSFKLGIIFLMNNKAINEFGVHILLSLIH